MLLSQYSVLRAGNDVDIAELLSNVLLFKLLKFEISKFCMKKSTKFIETKQPRGLKNVLK